MANIDELNVRRLEQNKLDVLLKELTVRDPKRNYTILALPEESYMILECSEVHHSVVMLKNMFLKLKGVVLDVRKDFFVDIIRMYKATFVNPKEVAEPTK